MGLAIISNEVCQGTAPRLKRGQYPAAIAKYMVVLCLFLVGTVNTVALISTRGVHDEVALIECVLGLTGLILVGAALVAVAFVARAGRPYTLDTIR